MIASTEEKCIVALKHKFMRFENPFGGGQTR